MARFYQIPIGGIFFEGETGEYYLKISDTDSHVYDIMEDHVYISGNYPIVCVFSPSHQVEDI